MKNNMLRVTKIPSELFSASIRSNDYFYGAVAKQITIEKILEVTA